MGSEEGIIPRVRDWRAVKSFLEGDRAPASPSSPILRIIANIICCIEPGSFIYTFCRLFIIKPLLAIFSPFIIHILIIYFYKCLNF